MKKPAPGAKGKQQPSKSSSGAAAAASAASSANNKSSSNNEKDNSSSRFVEELLAQSGTTPVQADYVVPAQRNVFTFGANSSVASVSVVPNEFAGVRVTRGTLALFGDDTAKQFALHIDKVLVAKAGSSSAGDKQQQVPGLLVKNGDIAARSAMMRNDAVSIFEQQMSALLNASLRQNELRQRENDDAEAGAAAKRSDDDADSDAFDDDSD
jgi:hypothetical protein